MARALLGVKFPAFTAIFFQTQKVQKKDFHSIGARDQHY